MLGKLRVHVRQQFVGYLALFVAVGGTAYAAATIRSSDVVDESLRSRDLKNNVAVRSSDVRDVRSGGGLVGADIRERKLDATPLRTRVGQGGCEGNDAQDAMVKVGASCIDRYEASVWSEPNGGTQYGVSSDDYPCNDNGQDCKGKIYARSVAGVKPSRFVTWFQAQQALANSGKRLATNAEWQQAVAGTPDPGTDNGTSDCNVTDQGSAQDPVNTGSRSSCVSAWGLNDMVGNLAERVADWDEQADLCGNWPSGYGSDRTCFGAVTPSRFPGALFRGGSFLNGSDAGPFAVSAIYQPSISGPRFGFRGAR